MLWLMNAELVMKNQSVVLQLQQHQCRVDHGSETVDHSMVHSKVAIINTINMVVHKQWLHTGNSTIVLTVA